MKKSFGLLAAALVVVAPLLLYVAAWRVFPLELNELSHRYEFWRSGVQEIRQQGLHGYLQDYCTGGPASQSCSCVAMIHGLGDNAMTWRYILNAPRGAWPDPVKLYAFDLPGSGKSPPPQDLSVYRVRREAEVLRRVLEQLCPYWTVVGNSMGGWVAAWLALDWPQGVAKVMLIDSAGLKSTESEKKELHDFFVEPTPEAMKEFSRRAYAKTRETPEYVWSAIARYMKESNARQVLEAQSPDDELDARLPTLHRPAVVVWGERDRLIRPEIGQRMHELIAGSAWREIPACGHLPQKECPVAVIKLLVDLLTAGGA